MWQKLRRLIFRQKEQGTHYRRRRNRLRLDRTFMMEELEDRRMLAIVWLNEFDINNGFATTYGGSEQLARQLVNRAIDMWEAVITDFNYDGDNNPATNNIYNLTLNAANLGGTSRGGASTTFVNGLPTQATVTVDDNGGGFGWYFDPTPFDDAEFTAIANSGSSGTGPAFHASFVDAQARADH